MIINDKICKRCRETKPVGEFHINATCKDGFQNACKTCYKINDKERYDAAAGFLDEMRVGEEGNCDTAIRYATTEQWADTMLYLLERIDKNPETGCYIWNKGKDVSGYGAANIPLPTTPSSNTRVRAHRLSFALSWGIDALPLGEMKNSGDNLDHTCGVRDCVNASHLQVIPHTLNASLQTEVRVAPKGFGRIIDATFASPELVSAIEKAGVDK